MHINSNELINCSITTVVDLIFTSLSVFLLIQVLFMPALPNFAVVFITIFSPCEMTKNYFDSHIPLWDVRLSNLVVTCDDPREPFSLRTTAMNDIRRTVQEKYTEKIKMPSKEITDFAFQCWFLTLSFLLLTFYTTSELDETARLGKLANVCYSDLF